MQRRTRRRPSRESTATTSRGRRGGRAACSLRDGELDSPPHRIARASGSWPTARSTSAASRSSPRGAGRGCAADAAPAEPAPGRTGTRSSRRSGAPGRPPCRARSPPRSSPSRPRAERRPRGSGRRAPATLSPIPIPLGGAVLVARGARRRSARGRGAGAVLTVRLSSAPSGRASRTRSAAGRRSCATAYPVFRANEAFTTAQLRRGTAHGGRAARRRPRDPLVTVDGRQPGYSVGMTNFELAQTLVRLGAVRAMALDGGGSTTMAFDGRLLNRPSDRRRRRVGRARSSSYTASSSRRRTAIVSPNGDGDRRAAGAAGEARPAVDRDGDAAGAGRLHRVLGRRSSASAGRFAVPFPPPPHPPPPPTRRRTLRGAVRPSRASSRGPLATARRGHDDVGQTTRDGPRVHAQHDARLSATAKPRLFLPPGGRPFGISWRQGRDALVVVTVESRGAPCCARSRSAGMQPGPSISRGTASTGRVAASRRRCLPGARRRAQRARPRRARAPLRGAADRGAPRAAPSGSVPEAAPRCSSPRS